MTGDDGRGRPASLVPRSPATTAAPPLERRRPGWIWTHIANGEHRSEATGALLKRMGVRPGVPDLLIAPDGLHCWMEIKRSRGGTLSEAQRQFRDGSRRARRAQRGLLRV